METLGRFIRRFVMAPKFQQLVRDWDTCAIELVCYDLTHSTLIFAVNPNRVLGLLRRLEPAALSAAARRLLYLQLGYHAQIHAIHTRPAPAALSAAAPTRGILTTDGLLMPYTRQLPYRQQRRRVTWNPAAITAN